ncbi:MAG: hypothetical protein AAGH70_13965 [Pseudomonadota bacterium]
MNETADPTAYLHVRIVIGMVLGLAIARTLNGLARFVQKGRRNEVDFLHLGWSVYLLLYLVSFWWFSFGYTKIFVWTFPVYMFVLFYAALLFLTCAVLYPDQAPENVTPRERFETNRAWLYSLLGVLCVVDYADMLIKGPGRLTNLGHPYWLEILVLAVLFVAAVFVRRRGFDVAVLLIAGLALVRLMMLEFRILQ